jgi:hypothetical protein
MIWKNKKMTFAVKFANHLADEDYGWVSLPNVNFWWSKTNGVSALEFAFLSFALSFRFGDVKDLV